MMVFNTSDFVKFYEVITMNNDYPSLAKEIMEEFKLGKGELSDLLGITGRTLADFLNPDLKRDIPVNQIKALQYLRTHLSFKKYSIDCQLDDILKMLDQKKGIIKLCLDSEERKEAVLDKIFQMEKILR